MTPQLPLVSIVMPAYKLQYLEQALDSALAQIYPALELVICDDNPGRDIEALVQQKQASSPFPIHYSRNAVPDGELPSTVNGIKLAQGKYIKFLHDDDVLEPECIASLVAVMENEAGIVLASSRRQRIDEDGEPLPDIMATCFPFSGDVIINGKELVSFLGDHTINFIGEPSCIMVRRNDVLEMAETLMSLNGKIIDWVGDLALCVKLLQRGNFAFLAKPLTNFRVSLAQFSQIGRDQAGIGNQGHADFRKAIRDLGWHRTSGNNRLVNVAPITPLKARIFKPVDLLAALQRAAGLGSGSLASWLGIRRPTEAQRSLIDQHLASQQGGPCIAIMLIDHEGTKEAIEHTLGKLREANTYHNIEIWVFSPLASLALPDDAKLVTVPSADGTTAAINAALTETQAEWILLAETGSEFMPSGLLISALDLPTLPASCHAAYADDILRLEDNELGLNLRPDLNLDLLLSFPASMSPHWFFRRSSLVELGGFSTTASRAFELEYQLRLIEQLGLGSIAHISEPVMIGNKLEMTDCAAEEAVIRQHLRNRGYEQALVRSHMPRCYAIDYGHALQPGVSIVIVVKDRLSQIQRCLETLLENTSYANYEVLLLDHGNQAADICTWLAGIESMALPQLRVLRFEAGLSREAICNQAAQQAHGEFLLWLGEGAGILSPDWLQQLLNHGQRPEVGAVSGKLVSADGKIRHAGLLLGLHGPAGQAFEGLSHDDSGYMQRLQLDQQYTALSRECLLLRRELFLQAGGFDEEPLLSRWADVDLCLKLHQAGFLNVWTPRVTLLMDMPLGSTASISEEDAMYARWLPTLARDPAYNPGFSLQAEPGFKLAEPTLSWRPLQAWKPVPTILAHHADPYGCGHYRVIQPLMAMRDATLIDGTISGNLLSPVELERYAPDAIILQRQTTEERVEVIRRMKAFSQAFKVYELDDYLPNLPMKNMHRKLITKDAVKALRQGLGFVDRFVVSTPALAEAFADLHADIRVVKNRLPVSWWQGLQSQRRISAKPRVGWAGGNSHTGDLELITDVVKELADEVEWVFFGMCPEALRPYVHEFHGGVPIDQYPQALANLNLDLALAPVEQNLFNECKSNLRLLEYGACGFPVICSDIRCYQEDNLPVTRVKNRFRDWVDAIRMHTADLDAAAKAGDALRQEVLAHWMLEGALLHEWRRAWLPDSD